MAIIHEGLLGEMKYISKSFEQKHINGLFAKDDILKQKIAFNLIYGNNNEVDELTNLFFQKINEVLITKKWFYITEEVFTFGIIS